MCHILVVPYYSIVQYKWCNCIQHYQWLTVCLLLFIHDHLVVIAEFRVASSIVLSQMSASVLCVFLQVDLLLFFFNGLWSWGGKFDPVSIQLAIYLIVRIRIYFICIAHFGKLKDTAQGHWNNKNQCIQLLLQINQTVKVHKIAGNQRNFKGIEDGDVWDITGQWVRWYKQFSGWVWTPGWTNKVSLSLWLQTGPFER